MSERIEDMHDVTLLHALRDAYELVKYYDSPDSEWASETYTKARARERLDALKHEAAKRHLPFMECLQ